MKFLQKRLLTILMCAFVLVTYMPVSAIENTVEDAGISVEKAEAKSEDEAAGSEGASPLAKTEPKARTVREAVPANAPEPLRTPEVTGSIWINDDTTKFYDTLNEANAVAKDGDIIHVNGKVSSAALTKAAITKNVTVDITENVTVAGDGKSNGISLSGGAKIQVSNGAKLTMSGFDTAITVGTDSTMSDGIYDLGNNKTGLKLSKSGKVSGSSEQTSVYVTAAEGSGVGFEYNNYTTFSNCTIIASGNGNGALGSKLVMKNASIETTGYWTYFNPKLGIYMDNSNLYVHAYNKYKPCIAILGDSELKNGSTITADGQRITLSAKMIVENSKVVIKNSSGGGLNINYTPA